MSCLNTWLLQNENEKQSCKEEARKRKSPAIFLKMRKTQEIGSKDNGNIEISENLLTSPANENNQSTVKPPYSGHPLQRTPLCNRQYTQERMK